MNDEHRVDLELLGVKISAIKTKIFCPSDDSVSLAQKCIDDINDFYKENQENISVLDMGCGTGFLGLAIAKHTDVKDIFFVDINEENMEFIYNHNISTFDKEINATMKISDIWTDLDGFNPDIVVANLPVTSEEGYNKMVEEAEDPEDLLPKEAYCAGKSSDGLLIKLIEGAATNLKENGFIYFGTFSENQRERIKQVLMMNNFGEIEEFGRDNHYIRAKLINMNKESE